MSNKIEEIKTRRSGLTEHGNWGITVYSGGLEFNGPKRAYAGTDPYFGEPRPVPVSEFDHIFVANAPADIDFLLAEVDRLQKSQQRWRGLARELAFAIPNRSELLERIEQLEAELNNR